MLCSRVALFFYWACDNIQIITQLKLRKGDADYWGQMGMLNWFISLLCNLAQFIRQYLQATTQLTYYYKVVKESPEKKEAFRDQIKASKALKFDAILGIIKTVGDILPAAKGASTLSLQ